MARWRAYPVPRGKEVMRFRLLYSGRLLGASKSDTRSQLKHEIRLEFSPQLKRLWETNEALGRFAQQSAYGWAESHPEIAPRLPDGEVFSLAEPANSAELAGWGLQYLGQKFSRAGQGFIPIVTEEMGLRCSLDLLFLRPETPGRIVHGGDIDNRLKTLFDALRLPQQQEWPCPADSASAGPIYCLFQDDSLITEVHVVTDNLLLLPHARESSQNDVFLVVDVKLETPAHGEWAWVFA
jgi:hypothetical protein